MEEKRVSSPAQFRNKTPHLPHERTLVRGRGRESRRCLSSGKVQGAPNCLLLVQGWLEPPPPHGLLSEPPLAAFQHKGPCGFSFLLSAYCLLPTLPFSFLCVQELSEAKAHGCQQINTTHESGFELRVYCGQSFVSFSEAQSMTTHDSLLVKIHTLQPAHKHSQNCRP